MEKPWKWLFFCSKQVVALIRLCLWFKAFLQISKSCIPINHQSCLSLLNSGFTKKFSQIQYYYARLFAFKISSCLGKRYGWYFKTDHATSIFVQVIISRTLSKSLRLSNSVRNLKNIWSKGSSYWKKSNFLVFENVTLFLNSTEFAFYLVYSADYLHKMLVYVV